MLNVQWISGKIPYYTMPPVRNQEEPSEANIVSQLGKVLNIDEVYNAESSFIGSLKSVSDFHPVEVPPSCPLNFDEDIVEVCDTISILFLLLSFFAKNRCCLTCKINLRQWKLLLKLVFYWSLLFVFGYKCMQKWLVALFIWYLLGVNVWSIELSVHVLQRYVE